MADSRLPISVCLIAANEAHRIRAALESVAGWTSEIVVVLNDDVNDGTDKIAESFGAKIFREPWRGFTRQKNSVAEKCTQPWLLNIDADEAVTPDLQKEIAAVVRENNAAYGAWEFPRCAFYCGRWIRHGDWYPDRVRRLWRRGAGQWVAEEPHARLEINGKIGRLRSDLHHFTNESIARHIAKIAPYHAAFVKNQVARGKSPGLFELVVRPQWRFVRAYIFKMGFLDGWQGFYIARFNAFSTLTKYAMVREAGQEQQNPK
jgi:glycosyltransferase involved in cell wall biosynthesis